jgi:hypothetical protein
LHDVTGKKVRSDKILAMNNPHTSRTADNLTVSDLINKLKIEFPKYDFRVLDGSGNIVNGQCNLSNVRATY